MSRKPDHDIANAILADLTAHDPLSESLQPPATPAASPNLTHDLATATAADTSSPRHLAASPPPAQDSSGTRRLENMPQHPTPHATPKPEPTRPHSNYQTAPDQDAFSPRPLPPSAAFLPQRRDSAGSRQLDNARPHKEPGGEEGAAIARRPYLQPSRVGKHRIQAWIGPKTKRQIKLISINHDITEHDLFRMALNMMFTHFSCPAIAFEDALPGEQHPNQDAQ